MALSWLTLTQLLARHCCTFKECNLTIGANIYNTAYVLCDLLLTMYDLLKNQEYRKSPTIVTCLQEENSQFP